MQHSSEQFISGAMTQVEEFNRWIAGLQLPGMLPPEELLRRTLVRPQADHICYKCKDALEFESIRSLFELSDGFIYQSVISKRRIAVIKMPVVLSTVLGDISVLELSDQKPDGSQRSGFDHVEVYPNHGTVESLLQTLESRGVQFTKEVRPHHTTYDTVLPSGFKVRLEGEPLVEKIKRDEMR